MNTHTHGEGEKNQDMNSTDTSPPSLLLNDYYHYVLCYERHVFAVCVVMRLLATKYLLIAATQNTLWNELLVGKKKKKMCDIRLSASPTVNKICLCAVHI